SETTDQLRRYAIGFVLLMSVGFACFLLLPVAGPRTQEVPNDAMYRLLVRYDSPLNSLPSLHIALATYSACVALAITPVALRRVLIVTLPAWVAVIGYATLATRQHYWVDLPPGIILGSLAQFIAWRHSAPAVEKPGDAGMVVVHDSHREISDSTGSTDEGAAA
ncbi:MAG TPA: phosphatase PAP2 family protein, partial [Blastocatellia bacterium]|nr:phosphatase PAP2 family protein [Blastocatellia bacterium]